MILLVAITLNIISSIASDILKYCETVDTGVNETWVKVKDTDSS